MTLVSAHFTATAPATYYDVLAPDGRHPKGTVMLLHGGSHTGAVYLATVDGRPGWAHDFVRHGYRVVIPDWPGRGRSGFIADEALTGTVVCAGLGNVIAEQAGPVTLMTHSMSGHFGWKLLETHGAQIDALIGVAPAPPGNMQPAPIVISESEAAVELKLMEGAAVMTLVRGRPLTATPGFINDKLIGTGTQFPRELIERYIPSLHPVPSRLVYERTNINGSALQVDPAAFAGKRIMIVTGTNDVDHPEAFERGMCAWLNAQGARAEFVYLGERGISGNGHMMMLERNSSAIADLIVAELEAG
jgi:pimeloyl-ACP methyl ester carboxylesterase